MTTATTNGPRTLERLKAMAEANAAAGFYYFDPDTMKCFGDRLTDFDVIDHRDRVYIVRRGGFRQHPGHDYGQHVDTHQIRQFMASGSVGQPINLHDDPEMWAVAYGEGGAG